MSLQQISIVILPIALNLLNLRAPEVHFLYEGSECKKNVSLLLMVGC